MEENEYEIHIDAKPGVKRIHFHYPKVDKAAFLKVLHKVVDAVYDKPPPTSPAEAVEARQCN